MDEAAVICGVGSVVAESALALEIPDNSATGLTQEIVVTEELLPA